VPYVQGAAGFVVSFYLKTNLPEACTLHRALALNFCLRPQSNACVTMESQRRDIGKADTWGSKDREDAVVQRAVRCMQCEHLWNP
jgi:hypothetical protein